MDMVARQHALNFTPGEEHQYTNVGYFLLAEVVKRIAKQSFREITASHMFDPLGMRSTVAFDDSGMIQRNRAMAYNPAPEGAFLNNVTLFDGRRLKHLYDRRGPGAMGRQLL
jgi:CubicO group peptidase (beta-lactamase class C family)